MRGRVLGAGSGIRMWGVSEAPHSRGGQGERGMPWSSRGGVVSGLSPLLPLQYVRVSQDTPSGMIYHLMTQHWGLDVPNLLISVTGGAKNFNMKPRLKSIFRRGLVKVAQTTGGRWVPSAGDGAGWADWVQPGVGATGTRRASGVVESTLQPGSGSRRHPQLPWLFL